LVRQAPRSLTQHHHPQYLRLHLPSLLRRSPLQPATAPAVAGVWRHVCGSCIVAGACLRRAAAAARPRCVSCAPGWQRWKPRTLRCVICSRPTRRRPGARAAGRMRAGRRGPQRGRGRRGRGRGATAGSRELCSVTTGERWWLGRGTLLWLLLRCYCGGGAGLRARTARCVPSLKSIPTSNVSSHSLHCYRNLFCCAVCKSVIPIRDRDAHMSEARGTK
jgi:hypothetical protein